MPAPPELDCAGDVVVVAFGRVADDVRRPDLDGARGRRERRRRASQPVEVQPTPYRSRWCLFQTYSPSGKRDPKAGTLKDSPGGCENWLPQVRVPTAPGQTGGGAGERPRRVSRAGAHGQLAGQGLPGGFDGRRQASAGAGGELGGMTAPQLDVCDRDEVFTGEPVGAEPRAGRCLEFEQPPGFRQRSGTRTWFALQVEMVLVDSATTALGALTCLFSPPGGGSGTAVGGVGGIGVWTGVGVGGPGGGGGGGSLSPGGVTFGGPGGG